MMYEEAPDVPHGRILNLPITPAQHASPRRLQGDSPASPISTSTSQSTRTPLSAGGTGYSRRLTYDQIKAFNADLYVTLLDNAESVHQRFVRDHDIDHTLKDIMVWREEELLATEMLANILKGYGHFFMVSRGRGRCSPRQTIFRLMFETQKKKVYPSFPMSHVMDLPDTLAEIDRFRADDQRAFRLLRSRRRR